jgi:acyl-CoA synthetase (AMP-forming)/AMP-acid ligase II
VKAILDRIAAVAPSTPVLVGEVGALTYGALLEASRDLAKQVNSVAPPGRPVAISLDNGPDFLV